MNTVTIEKLVFGGQGLGRLPSGQTVFVWNALPGETVEFEIIKQKNKYIEGIATHIVTPSPDRIPPKDEHFLSTSPWQIMRYEKENEWKKTIAVETYKKIGGAIFDTIEPDIVFPEEEFGYRNKMEFSFMDKNFIPLTKEERKLKWNHELPPRETKEEDICLSFFRRGGRSRFAIEKSELASPEIQTVATDILAWIREQNIPKRSLKTLIVRSNMQGEAITALFIKDTLSFRDYPKLTNTLKGFQLYYSTHKSPASVPTKLLYSVGDDFLTETLNLDTSLSPSSRRESDNPPLRGAEGCNLKYGLLSFFQVHIPIFTKALADIATHIPDNAHLIDFYSGVGSIGLPLADKCASLILVDNNKEAIEYAQENIARNNITHAEAHCIPAEKMTDIITSDKTIILDPPRAGLHEDVVHTLLAETPETIIYLSCNLSTQARDISLLAKKYHITFSRIYNFFPRTPHIEGLIVLNKKH